MTAFHRRLIERTEELRDSCLALSFPEEDLIPYHPLSYAWTLHRDYLLTYVKEGAPLFFLGMNPGPFGMGQNGVPFGEVTVVKDYLCLSGKVSPFPGAHAKRPVTGLSCERSEVSGKRLWSLIAQLYPDAAGFPPHLSVMNYCPVLFADRGEGGRNVVPEKLPQKYRKPLEDLCDEYLDDVVTLIRPEVIVGVGAYATVKGKACARRIVHPVKVSTVLHPSPASPAANRGWKEMAVSQLKEASLWHYL